MILVRLSLCVLLLNPGSPFGPGEGDDWGKLSKQFLQASSSGNPEQLAKALNLITKDNSKRSVDLLLKVIPTVGNAKYWAIITGLAQITSEDGLAAIEEEILRGKIPDLRRDLVMALRLCQSPRAIAVLHRLLKEGTPEIQASAIDELVDRADTTCVSALLDLAEKDPLLEREITRRVFRGLKALATEPPPNGPSEWRNWWKTRSEKAVAELPPLEAKPGTVGQTVTESLRRARATEYEDLKKGLRGDVLVIEGVSDKVEEVLLRLEIPHTLINWDQIQRATDLSLPKFTAIFVNCGTADWPPQQLQAIRQYVSQGGYLFVADIGVLQVVRRAFPGYYDAGKGTHGDQKVSIVPGRGTTGHPLLRGVDIPIWSTSNAQEASRTLEWTIDSGGPTFSFDQKRTITLVDAPDLLLKKKPSAVAVTFIVGGNEKVIQQGIETGGVYEEFPQMSGGRVLCVLSHFTKQRLGEDGFALQNLLINFLIEAKDRRLLREDQERAKKKK